MHMKNKINKQIGFGRRPRLLLWMLIILLSFIGSGCLPPPPRSAPKPPAPPGGPNAGAVKTLPPAVSGNIFLNLQG
jgi:hypothetical protein